MVLTGSSLTFSHPRYTTRDNASKFTHEQGPHDGGRGVWHLLPAFTTLADNLVGRFRRMPAGTQATKNTWGYVMTRGGESAGSRSLLSTPSHKISDVCSTSLQAHALTSTLSRFPPSLSLALLWHCAAHVCRPAGGACTILRYCTPFWFYDVGAFSV